MPETLVQRLRAYEGENWETTACYNGVRDEAAAEIERLTAELTDIKAALEVPANVHVNMLRGGIAKPSAQSIWHLYGRELLDAMPDDYRQPLTAKEGSE